MTTTATAPTKPQTGIAALGGQLRESVDGNRPADYADFRLDSQHVTVGHIGSAWVLIISDDKPIAPHTADLWAAAVGAPSTEWERTQQGRRWTAQWQEVGR
jgi:hypothetical protein